jgi:hypothetical protein
MCVFVNFLKILLINKFKTSRLEFVSVSIVLDVYRAKSTRYQDSFFPKLRWRRGGFLNFDLIGKARAYPPKALTITHFYQNTVHPRLFKRTGAVTPYV